MGRKRLLLEALRGEKNAGETVVRRAERFHPKRRYTMMREGVERETYLQWLSHAAPDVQLHHLMAGHWISSAIHVAAELKLADRLAAGPQSSTVLAQQT